MATRPVPEEPSAAIPPATADREASEALLDQIQQRVEKLRTERFAGGDPVVSPRPVRRVADALREGAIAALTAERLGALLQLDATLLAPAEDLAREELAAAYRALATWDLRSAALSLARAASVARFPDNQQRIALGWALYRLVEELLRLVPGQVKEKALPSVRLVEELLPTLDQLPEAERAFYTREAERLGQAWKHATTDERAWCVWALFRARVALLRNEGAETTLAWLLRLARRAGITSGEADDGLLTLLQRARAVFALLLAPPEEEATELSKLAAEAWPRDLYRAIAAALTQAWGEDAIAATHRFALALYVPESSPAEESPDA
ncbi:hypothetical protein [Thermomicrobium sp.]